MQDCPPQWNVNGWTKVFARCSTYLCLDLLLFHDKATGTQQENEQFDQHIGITMYRHRISCPSFCQCSWDCVQFRRVTCSQLALSGVNTVEGRGGRFFKTLIIVHVNPKPSLPHLGAWDQDQMAQGRVLASGHL